MFVKIKEKVSETPVNTSVSSVVFHGTHPKDVVDICQGDYAIFKGKTKQWRLLNNEPYTKDCCSYLVQPEQQPVPMEPNNSVTIGPFAWFGTKTDETDKYGPCQFEFNFTSILKAYQICRGSRYTICYRAAGTLVYRREVCHIVMICCLEDEECQNYPLITGNNTRYFKPPNFLSDTGQPIGLHFQTTINKYQKRHEHVTLALYLPNSRSLHLNRSDGKMKMTRHNYCIPSQYKEGCVKDPPVISIDKFTIIVRWLLHNEQDSDVKSNVPLNQSFEGSSDWLSSVDKTEYYRDGGDQYDQGDSKDYDFNFISFNDDDEQMICM